MADLLDNLEHHFKLDTDGADAHTALTLTQVNSPSFASSGKVYSTAVTLNGSNQYLYATDQASFGAISGTNAWTMACWVNMSSTASTEFIATQWSSVSGDRGWTMGYTLGTTDFRAQVSLDGSNAFNAVPSTTVSSGTWYCLIAWRPASSALVYCSVDNGTTGSVNLGSTGASINNSGLQFMIGNRSGSGDYFPGQIEGFSIWSADIGTAGRAAYYNSGSGLAYGSWTSSGGGGLSIPVAMHGYRQRRV